MLITELLNDGTIVHNYSDSNKYILQKETQSKYTEAYDVVPCSFTYEETDEDMPDKENDGSADYAAEEKTRLAEQLQKLKNKQIETSKYNLAQWLLAHPLKFTKSNGTTDYYSVTQEKQQLLALEIIADQLTIQSGEECTPSWNACGKPCEDWNIDELSLLAKKIRDYVKPRVSVQQHTEAEIQAAATEHDVLIIPVEQTIYD